MALIANAVYSQIIFLAEAAGKIDRQTSAGLPNGGDVRFALGGPG